MIPFAVRAGVQLQEQVRDIRKDNPALTVKYGTVKAVNVVDGTSNTLAIAEKAVSARQYNAKVWDWWELPGWAHNADWPNMRIRPLCPNYAGRLHGNPLTGSLHTPTQPCR